MDDLDWTYADDPAREATDGVANRDLSEPERTQPHLRAVFDLIVAQHPSFTELRVQDEWWGWARKAPGEPRRYTVETSRPLGALAAGAARRALRAGRRRARALAAAERESRAEHPIGGTERRSPAQPPAARAARRARARPARRARPGRACRRRLRASACSMFSTVSTPNAHGTPVSSCTCWIPRAASAQT